jgi:hypothetical protein
MHTSHDSMPVSARASCPPLLSGSSIINYPGFCVTLDGCAFLACYSDNSKYGQNYMMNHFINPHTYSWKWRMPKYSSNGGVEFVWLIAPIPGLADGTRLITRSGQAGFLHLTCSH